MASRGNSLIDRRFKKKQEEEYQKRLKNVKGKLDLTPPRNLSYNIQLNRLHAEQERQAAIDKQNLVIIEKLTEIKKSPGRVDHVNKSWKPSTDRLKKFRERRQRRIDQENKLLAERLQNVDSYYSVEDWEKDYKKHMYYMSMMENTTKDYDSVEYEDDEFEEGNSDEDEEDKESLPPVPPGTPSPSDRDKHKSSDEEDNISLPPIDEKGKKDEQGQESDKDGYSEHVAIMDAEELHTAIEENEKDKILEILGRTSEKEQFKKLCEKYKEMYKKDLMEDLESKVDSDVTNLLESLSSDSASEAAAEDAKRLHEAMKGLGTDEDTIIEILCTRNNKELAGIRDEYKKQFNKTLEEDLKGDTSGDVEKLLVQLSKGEREETEKVDEKVANKDASTLIEAGIGSWGTNEDDFIRVFTQRSIPQLAAMYKEYNKLAKMDIVESIDKEMDGDLQKAFLAIVKHSRDPSGAQTDKLAKAIEEGDTATVAKIILPMNKDHLSDTCASYKKTSKRELSDDIEEKCSGDLKLMLLSKLQKKDDKKKDKEKKDKKGKRNNADKLPPVWKKTSQQKKKEDEKKGEKKDSPKKDDTKQDKKAENAKKEEEKSQKDADELYQAIQDKDKEKIIDILAKNCTDSKKLKKLQDKYEKDHEEEPLADALKSVLDDKDLQDPIDCMFTSSAEYEAKSLNSAIKGIGTDEDMLIEILCRRNSEELAAIQEAYQKEYNTTLESDIKGDTSGDFEDLLVKLLKGNRDETDKVDKTLAKKEAEALYNAGAKAFGTDEDTFINILTQRNSAQLNATFAEYKKFSKVEIEESIEKEMSGDLEKGLLVLVKNIRNSTEQQSSKLRDCIESGNTDSIARLILSSDKAKLTEIMNAYKEANNKTLDSEVDKKCSENLKKLLLAKMGKGKDNQQQKANQAKGKEGGKDKGKSQSKPSPVKKQSEAAKGKKDSEASVLHKAIEANDKKKIKEIIVQHATDQAKLKKLADGYKKEHKKDLLDAIDSKLDEDLHEAVAAILLPSSHADARSLYLAMKGVGTNEALLIEILCTRTNSEIEAIKKDYSKQYERSLEDAVKSDTSGDFENLLVALLQCKRDEITKVNDDQAHKDAETLIEAGIKKWGTDENSFIEIFSTRSTAQLQAMFPEYLKWAKCDIEETISSEMDGDLQDGLLTLVKCIRDPLNTQTEKLHSALQAGDTATVARIIASKNEAALKDLESTYNTLHKPKLYFEVEKRCSPELKKVLLPNLKDKTQEKPAKKSQKAEPKKQSNEQKKKDNESDSSKLHNAIEKKDKKTIKEIVLRNATEKSKMKKLAEDYEKQHKAVLVDQLDSKIDDCILEAVTAMVHSPAENDARTLFYAMKGVGTKEAQLIEILCTRNNQEIQNITEEYRKKYGRSLEEDVKGDTSGDFEKLLTDLLKGKRDESTKVDEDLAHKDASALYEAGVKKWGTDEDKFIDILTTRSNAHLQAMMIEYEKLAGVTLQESIQDEMDGDLRDSLIMLLSCVQDDNKAQADKLHAALQDGDTSTVARVIAGAEKDKVSEIEAAYNATNKPKLYFEVNKKCTEDLKKIILHKLKDKKQEKEKPPPKAVSKKQSNASKNDKKPQAKSTAGAGAKEASKNNEEESTLLYKAIDKNDKKKITEIVVRNAMEKDKIAKLKDDYNKRYSKDLVEELDSKMDEDVHEAIATILLPVSEAEARSLYYAMKGVGTTEVHLIEILCSKSNEQMAAIKKEYQKKYGRSLEQDVKSETSGDFENLLTALMKGNRSESSKVDEESARKDASALYEAGVKKWGTDEDKFIEILTTRSNAHLQAMMIEYEKLARVTLQKSIQDEMDGDLRDGLIMLLSCVQDDKKAQADKLHAALQDGDTSTVARVIAGAEKDKMKAIEESYNSLYDPKLYFEVDKKCSEDLKKILLDKLKDKTKRKKSPTQDKQSKRTPPNSAKKNKKESNNKPSDMENNTASSDNPTQEDQQYEDASSDKPTQEDQHENNDDGAKEERPKIDIPKIEYHGTVLAAKDFDAGKEAEQLKKAMKGFGSDEDAIIDVLGSCSSSQRQEIITSFKQKYDKDLIEELKSELSGKFEDTIVCLLSTAAVYDANSLNAAMKGLGTNESLLAEIICSRPGKEIQDIKEAYKANFDKDLVEAVKGETSGDLCDLLTALLQAKRPSSDNINEDAAYGDAQKLYEAGEKKWGTDESMFVNILTTRSPTQLKAIFQAYKHISKKDIIESVDNELEGDFMKAVKTLVVCTGNPPDYFAESLHEALTGVLTSNSTVARIIITRSEIDLMDIKKSYQEKYGKSLADEVKESLKGDQETLLLKLLGE